MDKTELTVTDGYGTSSEISQPVAPRRDLPASMQRSLERELARVSKREAAAAPAEVIEPPNRVEPPELVEPAGAPPSRYKRAQVNRPEVDALWERYWAAPGDDTRNALVEVYHDFAGEVTRRFATRLPRSVDRGDLITAGHVGVMNAISGFDPERGVRFESYCELRVKGALLDELRTQDWLPRPWRQRVEHQKRAVEAVRGREGREPADEEVAGEMGLGVDLYQQLFGVGLPGTPAGSMSLDGSDEDMMVALEVIPDPAAIDPDEGLSREELLTLVTQRMTEQEFRILFLRYWEGMAMREIGELTDLSESRVCKIHTRLIERLQERLRVPQDLD